jgi:hypothetical protein
LAGRPCLIIGVRECRHETGKFVRRASVEATSVVGDRARVRRFRRIRSLRISGRPAQTAAALAGACGQAASHPRIGGRAVPFPVPSERASVGIRKGRKGGAHPARIRPAPRPRTCEGCDGQPGSLGDNRGNLSLSGRC